MGPGIGRTVAPRRALHRRFLPVPAQDESPRPRRFPALYPDEPEACRRSLRPFLINLVHLALLLARLQGLSDRGARLPGAYLPDAGDARLAGAAGALPGPVPLEEAAVRGGVDGRAVPGRRPLGRGGRAGRRGGVHRRLLPADPLDRPRRGLRRDGRRHRLLRRPRSTAAGLPDHAWTIAASMFMFRMIIYLYELKHAKTPESPARHAQLLLPAAELLLPPFPGGRLPDHAARATSPPTSTRSSGAGSQMMFRGTMHLLALSPGLSRAADPRRRRCTASASLSCYLVCNYLLYLQVSGQFHMACGMLHLFGFQLPETHHHYLLATSFTDYWRRINIYWKDFMVRVFFNPVVFRLKRWPQPAALAVATAVVFLATWLLHALPVVLAARELGLHAFPTPCSGASWAAWCWSTSSSTPAGSRPQRAQAASGGTGSARRAGGARREGRRHVHHDRPALVALVEPQPGGLARHARPRLGT